jgi:outer membrane protein OmpA-like peptidoglycan-associated protein
MKKTMRLPIALFLSLTLLFGSCANWSKTAKGAATGTAAGAAVGAGIGALAGNTAKGAIIGAVVGGAAGTAIGVYMDKQAKELEEELEGATVERVGEGIAVTFDSGLLFGFDSYALSNAKKEDLRELAGTLQKYPDTNIIIEGHTDSKGADAYNQTLSENRANAVADYVVAQGVSRSRLTTKGYGETSPVASNDTDEGRAQNRRVNVIIIANEELKEKAEDGQLN